MDDDGLKKRMEDVAGRLGLGATGQFPDGQIAPTDEGELRLAVGAVGGNVCINYGKPVAYLAMSPDQARQFAWILLAKAGEIDGKE